MKTSTTIPSPIPYLLKVPDFRAENSTYDWRMLFMLVLMALGSGRTNVLAIGQWVEDRRDWLVVLGFGRRKSGMALPAQATIYRFLWGLEEQNEALEKAMKEWAKAVLKTVGVAGDMLQINLDGKHLKGSARGGVGDRAMVLISAYLAALGLSLAQAKSEGDEGVNGRKLIMELEPELKEIAVPWVFSADAAHTEVATAEAIIKQGGATSSHSKTTRPS